MNQPKHFKTRSGRITRQTELTGKIVLGTTAVVIMAAVIIGAVLVN